MASTVPNQERIVDPFASYNSNVVNKITQIVTQDSNGLLTTNSLQVALDSTSPTNTVVVSTGYIVKDDVVISITSEHQVDFTDGDNYVSGGTWTASGYYYLVLDYTYVKSRPAPQASIKILTPSERSLLTTSTQYCLLKVIEVTAGPQISNLYDKDPSIPTNARKYLKYYAGSTVDLPSFLQDRDQSRIAYESARDKYYFGYSDGWRELSAGGISTDVNTDTTGIVIGSLCYVDENRDAQPALATSFETGADLVVLSIGTAISGEGRGSVAGFAEDVPVESGILIDIGDLLYLSASEPGKVTNVKTAPVFQVVGRALSQGSSTTPIEIIFSPKVVLSTGFEGQISTWQGPDGEGRYYKNIDVSLLDGTNAFDCHWFDHSDHTEITPTAVQILNNGNIIRVYLTDSTTIVDYVISSAGSIGGAGGGGGGGSGVTDHSLLTSLDYASSGHVGFAPTVHFHPQYVDVPSGEVVLFESNVAVSGYTLKTDKDDMVVYITKGSVAGGETGGTDKIGGTWTQPNHTHNIAASGDHTHDGPLHNHATSNHTLTLSQIPSHRHYLAPGCSSQPYDSCDGINYGVPDFQNSGSDYTDFAGGGGAHNHGDTSADGDGLTSLDGDHDHGGATAAGATVNTWRPTGRNFTRQQRI